MRGWTSGDRQTAAVGDVFPCCAGVDRRLASCKVRRSHFPPVRGGGPGLTSRGCPSQVFSPGARGWTVRTTPVAFGPSFSPGVRGWTVHGWAEDGNKFVFPRCPGVDRRCRYRARPSHRFPPVRGGGPSGRVTAKPKFVFSPGVRGWTDDGRRWMGSGELFPRCAGLDRGSAHRIRSM